MIEGTAIQFAWICLRTVRMVAAAGELKGFLS